MKQHQMLRLMLKFKSEYTNKPYELGNSGFALQPFTRSHLEFEWRAWMCVARMETPCPARRPCIIRSKSPVRHQSHHYRVNPWWKFPANSRWRRRRDGQRGNRVKHPKFNSNPPVSLDWSHDARLNGSKNSRLFNCGSICMLNVWSAERKRSVRPSVFCVWYTFSFQRPSQARNVRREPCDKDLSWPATDAVVSLRMARGRRRKEIKKGSAVGKCPWWYGGWRTQQNVVSVWWPRGWMSGFPRGPCHSSSGHIQTIAAARETCRRHHLEMRTYIELRLDIKSLWKSANKSIAAHLSRGGFCRARFIFFF